MPSSRASIARASQLEWFHQRRQRHLRRLPSIEYHVDEGGCQQGETQQANVDGFIFSACTMSLIVAYRPVPSSFCQRNARAIASTSVLSRCTEPLGGLAPAVVAASSPKPNGPTARPIRFVVTSLRRTEVEGR